MTTIRLDEQEARRWIVAQRDTAQATVKALEARDAIQAIAGRAAQQQAALFDALVTKYGLDPAKSYALNEETLVLTVMP